MTYCPRCGKKKSCGLHHVYVIELQKTVLNEKRFCPSFERNSATKESKCFYVGQTKHRPECRYKQHVANRTGARYGFDCTCEDGRPKRIPFNAFNRGNAFVRNYHEPGGLRREYVNDINPIRGGKEKAEQCEQELAEWLLNQGHAVHFN